MATQGNVKRNPQNTLRQREKTGGLGLVPEQAVRLDGYKRRRPQQPIDDYYGSEA